MKLTSQQLQQIIKEELQAVLGEQEGTPEEAGLDPEQEKKLAPQCRNPDFAESANISANSLGYQGENFCLDMAYKEFDELIGRQRTPDEARIIRKILKKFGVSAIFTFAKAYADSGLKIETKIEGEVLLLVIQNKELEGVINFLKREKLVLLARSELVGFNPLETYLTHQDLEAIFKMFNPPEHKREEDEDLGGVMTEFVDQSKQRAQMLTMLAKFPTQKLKVERGSSVDEVRFREDDFGGQMPKNIEFSN